MPQNNIPPPDDYNPRSRPPQTHHPGGKYGNERSSGNRNTHRKHLKHYQMPKNRHQQYQAQVIDLAEHQERVGVPRDRFHRNDDDDYFATVQDEEENDGEKSDTNRDKLNGPEAGQDDDDDDPLDAYMKSIEGNTDSQIREQEAEATSRFSSISSEEKVSSSKACSSGFSERGVRLDIDGVDDGEEDYLQKIGSSLHGTSEAEDEPLGDQCSRENDPGKNYVVEYDRHDNISTVRRIKRDVDPLPSIDHSTITYSQFERNFYKEHPEIEKLTQEQSEDLRCKLEIKVSGESPPKPVCSFAHFNFDEQLMKVIRRSEYTQPTPIQAQAIPAALLGRNIIGIALTGSGKTAAYLWPMIVHIMGQPNLKRGDGPIGLVLVPTRELALQVYGQAKKFSHSYRIAVVCAYGGGSKYEQSKDLEAGAEIVVATPGRLIDLIKLGATNFKRVTYLVLDEADRFFEMGFEAQVRSICDHIRPNRQTLLFSATFKHRMEHLARKVVENPIKIVQKNLGDANEDVKQHAVALSEPSKKWDWLLSSLVKFTSAGSVLIFVTRIANSEELHRNLNNHGEETLLLHGDMDQSERNRVIMSFKRKEKSIMIATDVAARGLDISHIRTVINYDVARDIDTHVHRVGRTGRAGSKGDAYTLLTEKDREFAGQLVKNLESSNHDVSDELMKIAMQSHAFRKSRRSGHHHNLSKRHHSDSSHSYSHEKGQPYHSKRRR